MRVSRALIHVLAGALLLVLLAFPKKAMAEPGAGYCFTIYPDMWTYYYYGSNGGSYAAGAIGTIPSVDDGGSGSVLHVGYDLGFTATITGIEFNWGNFGTANWWPSVRTGLFIGALPGAADYTSFANTAAGINFSGYSSAANNNWQYRSWTNINLDRRGIEVFLEEGGGGSPQMRLKDFRVCYTGGATPTGTPTNTATPTDTVTPSETSVYEWIPTGDARPLCPSSTPVATNTGTPYTPNAILPGAPIQGVGVGDVINAYVTAVAASMTAAVPTLGTGTPSKTPMNTAWIKPTVDLANCRTPFASGRAPDLVVVTPPQAETDYHCTVIMAGYRGTTWSTSVLGLFTIPSIDINIPEVELCLRQVKFQIKVLGVDYWLIFMFYIGVRALGMVIDIFLRTL